MHLQVRYALQLYKDSSWETLLDGNPHPVYEQSMVDMYIDKLKSRIVELEDAQRWRNVKDELPADNGQNVLAVVEVDSTYSGSTRYITEANFSDGTFFGPNNDELDEYTDAPDGTYYHSKVTKWCPIPKPPEV